MATKNSTSSPPAAPLITSRSTGTRPTIKRGVGVPPELLPFVHFVPSRLQFLKTSQSTNEPGPKLAKAEGIPEALCMRGPDSGDLLLRKDAEELLHVCPTLHDHFPLAPRLPPAQLP